MLVNLVFRPTLGTFLDPFAGIGGIVIEALASGWKAVSCDIDSALHHGLSALGAEHHVCDARDLPLASQSVDAIATEPPYDSVAASMLPSAICEMYRVLRAGGRLGILCAGWQVDIVRHHASNLGLKSFLDSPVNRKGLDVAVLAWEKRY
jgi:tRNA G10  N-methylase Trm11